MKKLHTLIITILMVSGTAAQQPYTPNYDESKVPAYTLPEILQTNNGKSVTTKEQWEKIRRPEILKLFEDNVYGQMPKDIDSITFTTTHRNDTAMQGKAQMKEVTITGYRNNQSVSIHLVIFIPKINTPAPLFLLINNRGKELTDPTRKIKSEFWPAEMLIDSGFAIAAFQVGDLAQDHKDGFMNGVLRLYPEQLNASNGMRAIGAWAWGASRAMDYVEQDKDINAKQVAVVGHSRGGKAALWASAQDQRFAICVTNNSGNTGAALSRRRFGETIAVINSAFPHWFTPNYKKYNDNENASPVDQHMLIALSAPRLLYATNASKDLWADPAGTYLSMRHAEKVYALYGKSAGLPVHPPRVNAPIIKAPFGYHNREGVHDMTEYDWKNFIALAKQQTTR